MKDGMITVVLVDDHAVVRAGLKAVLGTAKDIQIIGEGSNGKDAISLATRLDPDVIEHYLIVWPSWRQPRLWPSDWLREPSSVRPAS